MLCNVYFLAHYAKAHEYHVYHLCGTKLSQIGYFLIFALFVNAGCHNIMHYTPVLKDIGTIGWLHEGNLAKQ